MKLNYIGSFDCVKTYVIVEPFSSQIQSNSDIVVDYVTSFDDFKEAEEFANTGRYSILHRDLFVMQSPLCESIERLLKEYHHPFDGISKQIDELDKKLSKYQREMLPKISLFAKQVLTLDDAVLFTGLKKSYLYKLTCRKEIPHYKPKGEFIYFDRAELEAWMKQNRVLTQIEAEQKADLYCIEHPAPAKVIFNKDLL